MRFAAAIREADALDASLAPKTGRLCGVPVSVKDQCTSASYLARSVDSRCQHSGLRSFRPGIAVDLAGYDTSVGFSSWSHKPAKEDAVVRVVP